MDDLMELIGTGLLSALAFSGIILIVSFLVFSVSHTGDTTLADYIVQMLDSLHA